VQVGTPDPNRPTSGVLEIAIECSPSVSPKLTGRTAQAINAELTQMMERMFRASKFLETNDLCIIPGKVCWVVQLDATILDLGGNVADAISLAVYTALRDARIPNVYRVEMEKDEDTAEQEVELAAQYELDPDFAASVPLCCKNLPIMISLSQLAGGRLFLADATPQEESCALGAVRVAIAVDSHGDVCMLQQGGTGSIELSVLKTMIKSALRISRSIFGVLDAALEEEHALAEETMQGQSFPLFG
jgi:exosome complex component RRP42